jgi:polysaccharide export outer membrane protein
MHTHLSPAGNAQSGMLRTWIVSMLLAACGFGCASTSNTVPATAAAAQPEPVAAQYIIGPGDVLKIVVLRNPELNADVPVRPDGKISTPLVNDVVAVGKTPTQLASEIDKMLSEFVRQPNVSVIVSHATSASSQVKVVGQAVTPRALPYRAGMTVLDLVIEVGGLSQFAAGNRAKIIRSDGTTTREIRVRLNDLLNKGQISENINLQPGDILFIPETLF